MPDLDRILERYDLRSIERAIEKRRSLEEQRASQLEERRRELESELRKLEEMSGGSGPSARGARARSTNGRRVLRRSADGRRGGRGRTKMRVQRGQIRRKPNARRFNDISLADALQKVMAARRKPIHYRELTETVQRKNIYRTKSKNLLSTVAVTLKRDGRFKKIEPGIYALR